MPEPAARKSYLRELDPEGLPMVRAIAKLRDEVTAVHMMQSNGHSRELALVLTKLDEAKMWAVAHGERVGEYAVLPRGEIIRQAVPDTTDTTVPGEASRVV